MPPTPTTPKTLKELADRNVDDVTKLRTAAVAKLTETQTASDAAETAYEEALEDLTERQRDEADVRRRLAEAPTPADAEALLDDLEAAVVAARRAQAAVVTTEAESEARKAEAAGAQAQVAQLDAELEHAQGDVEAAKSQDEARTQLKRAAAEPPLSDVKAQATAAKSSTAATEAKERVEESLPASLLARARDRLATERASAKRRRDAAATTREALNDKVAEDRGKQGELAAKWAAFRIAEERLTLYATGAPAQLARATALLERARSSPELTDAERPRIDDDDLEDAREEAATKEQERDAARADLEQKEVDYRNARLTVLAENPYLTDEAVDAHADVAPKRTLRDDAKDTLEQKQEALDEVSATLDTWEAAVPDSRWEALAAYEDALATLNELGATDPATLLSAYRTAEQELVEALAAETRRARSRRLLEAEIAAGDAAVKAAARTEPSRLLAALRGDA